MKLLAKSEINTLKARDRFREGQEGMKIAARVDRLREVQAAEEASLEKFRKETISRINAEITEKTAQRDLLSEEVTELEKKIERGLKPLEKERVKIEEARNKLLVSQQELEEAKKLLAVATERIANDKKEANDELLRATEEKRRAEKLLQDADKRDKEASAILSDAQLMQQKVETFKYQIEATLKGREEAIVNSEKRQRVRDNEQDRREVGLNARETRIADRERLLERNLTRKNNHGG